MQTLLRMYDNEATGDPVLRSDYKNLYQPCNGQMFHKFDTVFVQIHPVWWLNLCENLSTNPDFRSAMQFDKDDMATVNFKKFVTYEPFVDEHGKIQRGRCDAHKDNIGPKMGPVFIKLRHPERNNKNSGAFQTLEAYVIHERCCKTTCQNAACSSFEHCLEHITDPKVAGPLTDQYKLSWDTGKRSHANLVKQMKQRTNAAMEAYLGHRSPDRLKQDLEACNTKSMELKHNGRPVKLRWKQHNTNPGDILVFTKDVLHRVLPITGERVLAFATINVIPKGLFGALRKRYPRTQGNEIRRRRRLVQ